MQNLTVRLEMVFGQVKAAASGSSEVRVIDVGSDHGYLALRCLEDGIAKNAVCTEIHEGPARKSQAALKGAGYSEVSEVHVTDGLIGVQLKDNDIVVIAGMGGLNIIDIISQAIKDNGTDVLKNVTFVLQPQKSNEIVRKYLAETGFAYIDETVCYDRDIFYNCMRVVYKGITSVLTDEQACYGPLLINKFDNGDKEVSLYFEHLNKIFEIRKRSNPTVKSALEERKQNERK